MKKKRKKRKEGGERKEEKREGRGYVKTDKETLWLKFFNSNY